MSIVQCAWWLVVNGGVGWWWWVVVFGNAGVWWWCVVVVVVVWCVVRQLARWGRQSIRCWQAAAASAIQSGLSNNTARTQPPTQDLELGTTSSPQPVNTTTHQQPVKNTLPQNIFRNNVRSWMKPESKNV